MAIETTQPAAQVVAQAHAQTQVQVQGLRKRYGSREALAGLSFALLAGQWVALLGPNGAGKSTLFQVLTGLFAADEGTVHVTGHALHLHPAAALARLGVVFQQMSLDLDLSVLQNLRFHAALHGLPSALATQRIEQGCATFGLHKDLKRAVRELSGGNRRKVELVRALLHRPAVLLLDEPTVGLDPRSRQDLLKAVEGDVRSNQSAVLWATHLVEEAERADRVLVLHKGQSLADGSPAQVAQMLGGGSLEQAFLRATA